VVVRVKLWGQEMLQCGAEGDLHVNILSELNGACLSVSE